MKDVNYPCMKSYLLALTGISYNSTNVPCYYGTVPDNIAPENYIVFGNITNVDASSKTCSETFTSMRVTIHTFDMKYNTGKAAAAIAGEVFTRIYPTPNAKIDLSPDNMQCISTELTQDVTQDYGQVNSRVYLDRILIFRHKIFHR